MISSVFVAFALLFKAACWQSEKRWYAPKLSFNITGVLDVKAVKTNSSRPCRVKGQMFKRDLTLPHTDWPPDPWHSVHTFVWHSSSFRADGALGFRMSTVVHEVNLRDFFFCFYTGFKYNNYISIMLQTLETKLHRFSSAEKTFSI